MRFKIDKTGTRLLTLEIDGQPSGDDQQRDGVEEYLHESEPQSSGGYVMAARHVSDDLKAIRERRCRLTSTISLLFARVSILTVGIL